MNSFVIRTYGRTELALLYSPHLCPRRRLSVNLRQWIDLYPGLRENLLLQGGSARSRSYTPAQWG